MQARKKTEGSPIVKIVVSFLMLWALIVGIVLTQAGSAGAGLPKDALSRAESSGILRPVLQLQAEDDR